MSSVSTTVTVAILPFVPVTVQSKRLPFLMSTSSGQVTDAIATRPPGLLSRPALMERSALSVSIFFEQPAAVRAVGRMATTASRRRIRGGHLNGAVEPEARGRHSVGLSDRIAATPPQADAALS